MATFKIQSAMEYLMTYGWAILIIAVVLGALFGLGFFNSANLAPKISAGSCQVYRPNGPSTTAYINTEGVCNNELPQYTAQFSGAGTAIPASISVTGVSVPTGYTTVAFWMYSKTATAGPVAFSYNTVANGIDFVGSCFGMAGTYGVAPSTVQNSWVFVTAVFNTVGANDNFYINGVSQAGASGCTTKPAMAPTSTIYIGGSPVASTTFNGMIANVQLYNYSLPVNDIVSLYDAGIGADPQALNNIVGWWQLNGNPYDYSGNLYNGVTANTVFTSAWTTGYTAP